MAAAPEGKSLLHHPLDHKFIEAQAWVSHPAYILRSWSSTCHRQPTYQSSWKMWIHAPEAHLPGQHPGHPAWAMSFVLRALLYSWGPLSSFHSAASNHL